MGTSDLPVFFNTAEFAALYEQAENSVRLAALNYCTPPERRTCRNKLPEGFGAFKWGRVHVIYPLSDQELIATLFRVELA